MEIAKRSVSDLEITPARQLDSVISRAYHDHPCPAELILPFRMPGPPKSLLSAIIESRYIGPLWNMDFPWIVTLAVTFAGVFLFAVLPSFSEKIGLSSMMFGAAVMAAFPIFSTLCSPLIYPVLVGLNMRSGFGKDWVRTLLAPTHISVTDSGFKLYFRGRWYYNYPNLAIWAEVFEAELVQDPLYDSIALRFVYQSGFGRLDLMLPLCGFATKEDALVVLEHFANFVPEDHQGRMLRLMASENFETLFKVLDNPEAEEMAWFESINSIFDKTRVALGLGSKRHQQESIEELTLDQMVEREMKTTGETSQSQLRD